MDKLMFNFFHVHILSFTKPLILYNPKFILVFIISLNFKSLAKNIRKDLLIHLTKKLYLYYVLKNKLVWSLLICDDVRILLGTSS